MKKTKLFFFYLSLTLIFSFFNYFYKYYQPANLFWDENYHIVSAYKYLNKISFMSDHPPLGKIFIALGEKIFYPNQQEGTSSFFSVNSIKEIPKNFSFIGLRFFPVLFATISIIPFFLILYQISKNPHLSFLFSGFYLFENAIIVHSRGAMLDSIQIFFIFLSILYFLFLFNQKKKTKNNQYFFLGLLIGLIIATKLNGIIFFLLFPFLYFYQNKLNQSFFDFLKKGIIFVIASSLIFLGTYTLHLFLTEKNIKIEHIPILIKKNLEFIPHYEKRVPRLDFSKTVENGSSPTTWAFGNKSINYRWAKSGNSTQYLYLQGNPLIWFCGILGICLSIFLLLFHLFSKTKNKNSKIFYLIIIFTALYLVYMGFMLTISRVMYLYHYFIPLIISLLLFFLLFNYQYEKLIKINNQKLLLIASLFLLLIVFVFYFFSPLTYYLPLTDSEFQIRCWFPFWHLTPIK